MSGKSSGHRLCYSRELCKVKRTVLRTKPDKHQLKRRGDISLRRKQVHVYINLCVIGSQVKREAVETSVY